MSNAGEDVEDVKEVEFSHIVYGNITWNNYFVKTVLQFLRDKHTPIRWPSHSIPRHSPKWSKIINPYKDLNTNVYGSYTWNNENSK